MEICKQMNASTDKKGIVGLTNIGNTCYGNATLQAIRHQVDFTIFLLQENHKKILDKKEPNEKTILLEKYSDLVHAMWKTEHSYEKTHDFWSSMIPSAMKAGFEQFRFPQAHDAHEFLVFLLDTFHEALANPVKMVIKDTTKGQAKEALEFWKKSFEKIYSPFVDLVFGLQRKSICCSECKKESVTWETLNMFKVSVPKLTSSTNPVELLDLMASEGSSESIEDYSCDSCSPKRTKADITHTMWRLGNWVIVVLKRIENNGRRINTPVNIPLTTTFERIFHSSSPERSGKDKYQLFATINHHGSAGGGHYTAQAKHPVTGEWVFYDDERTSSIQEPTLDPSVYIVMFRRITPEK